MESVIPTTAGTSNVNCSDFQQFDESILDMNADQSSVADCSTVDDANEQFRPAKKTFGGRKRKASDQNPSGPKTRKTDFNSNIRVIFISFQNNAPNVQHFTKSLRGLTGKPNPGSLRMLKDGSGFSVKPCDKETAQMMNPESIRRLFPNSALTVTTARDNKNAPCFVIKDVCLSITTEDVKAELHQQGIPHGNVFRIKSQALNKETRLVRVFTNSMETCKNVIRDGILIFMQRKKCEISKQQPKVVQCYKCLEFGHIAEKCNKQQKCARCGADHSIKQCSRTENTVKCANCNENHSANYKGCNKYQEAQYFAKQRQYADVAKKQEAIQAKTQEANKKQVQAWINENLGNSEYLNDYVENTVAQKTLNKDCIEKMIKETVDEAITNKVDELLTPLIKNTVTTSVQNSINQQVLPKIEAIANEKIAEAIQKHDITSRQNTLKVLFKVGYASHAMIKKVISKQNFDPRDFCADLIATCATDCLNLKLTKDAVLDQFEKQNPVQQFPSYRASRNQTKKS